LGFFLNNLYLLFILYLKIAKTTQTTLIHLLKYDTTYYSIDEENTKSPLNSYYCGYGVHATLKQRESNSVYSENDDEEESDNSENVNSSECESSNNSTASYRKATSLSNALNSVELALRDYPANKSNKKVSMQIFKKFNILSSSACPSTSSSNSASISSATNANMINSSMQIKMFS
jgi:hypothetical protein